VAGAGGVVVSAIAIQRTTFSTSRTLEFCSTKELVAQTGHEPADWPLVIIRELIDNALDACEEAGIAPVIRVTVARGCIRVRDNGPGLPPETVASILDFTTRTSSREAYVAPDWGRKGNALKTILAIPLALSGDEGRVEIVARGIRHEITFRVDRIAQRPVVDHRQHCLSGMVTTGTAITVHWPALASSDLEAAGSNFLPLVTSTCDFNPHLSISGTWLDAERRGQWRFEAIDPGAPTSPHWYRVADLERLAGAFLSHDRERKTVRVLRDFLTQFDGLSGTAKCKTVLEDVGLQRASMDRLLLDDRDEFNHVLVARLLAAMQAAARPIKPKALGPLGKDTVAATFSTWQADPETYRYKMFTGDDYGVPWIVEAAMACLPEGRSRQLLSGINWSPAFKDPFDLGFQLGNSWCGPFEPIILLIHLICPRPEFRDRGKSSIASRSPGVDAIKDAVEFVTADWTKQRRAAIRDQARAQKRLERMRMRTVTKLSLKDAVLQHLPGVIASTSENGQLSFTQRDLFYAIRPLVQQDQEKSLAYGYFTGLLTECENEHGEIAGLQREPRGTLYHPHRREEIPLSTETVARYGRPFWNFNKLVYIEKAGTQQNLFEVGWAEEHDCAIASVAGFTTRAVKDLFDILATSIEPLTVFCVHDADAAGTMIYHTLVAETKARGARKIEVINLGLEPWEGVQMGLEIEPVEGTDRRRAVAPYVAEHDEKWRPWLRARGFNSWSSWLQRYRIELNAMPPARRIAWLTEKIDRYPPRKVVPPPHVLHLKRVSAARDEIRDELTRRARIEERTEEIVARAAWSDQSRLPPLVTRFLDRARQRRASWICPMKIAGRKLAKRILTNLDAEGKLP
jgi:DNA topoisomerase VI subunit B